MNAIELLQDLLRDLFLDQRSLLRWAWEELGLSLRRGPSRRELAARAAQRVVSLGLVDEELFWGLVARCPTQVHRIRRARATLLTGAARAPFEEPLLHDAPVHDADVPTVDEDLISTEGGPPYLDGADGEGALPELELDDLNTEEVFPPVPGQAGAVVARVVEAAPRGASLTGLMQPILLMC